MIKDAILHIIEEMNKSPNFNSDKFTRITRHLNVIAQEFELDLNVQLTLNVYQNGLNITYNENSPVDGSDRFDVIILRDMFAGFGMENTIVSLLKLEVPGEKGQGTATRELIKYCEQRPEAAIIVNNVVDVNPEFIAEAMASSDGQIAEAKLLQQSKFFKRIGFVPITEYISKYVVNPDFLEKYKHELESEVLIYTNSVGLAVLYNLKKLANVIPTPFESTDTVEVVEAEIV